MDFGIANKRALVLGASRGLGGASAAALAAEGVDVIAVSRSGATAEPAAGIRPIAADLGDPGSVAKLIEEVLAEGGVDILVNNSGGPAPGTVRTTSAQSWQDAFAMLAAPLFAITAALVPGMVERQWGRIITIGSSGIVQPIPNLALSNGVRAAIAGWSKTLSAEVASDNVTVNMILPGRIDTSRVRELDGQKAAREGISVQDVAAQSRRSIPAGRYGRAEEFGAVVAFLASQQASYITGAQVRVDGGAIQSH